MRPRRSLPHLLAALLLPSSLFAQAKVDRLAVQAELGFNGASGNSSFSILRTGFRATYLRSDASEFEASGLVRYGRSDGKVIADDQKGSLKMDLWPKADVSPFVFAEASSDKIRRLDFRFSGGAGAKWTFWTGAAGRGSVSAAALYDYRDFKATRSTAADATEALARWSVRTRVNRKLSASASFEQVALYQPVWDDPADYVLDVTNSVSTRLNARLTLALEHQYLRDSEPPTGVEPSDQRYSVLLKLAF